VRGSRQLPVAAEVLRQTLCDVRAAQAMEWSAALACDGVLSVFHLLLAGVAVASYVFPRVSLPHDYRLSWRASSPGVVDFDPIISAAIAARTQIGLFAIVHWLLAGRRILGALVTALNRVSDVDARQETVQCRALIELVPLTSFGVLVLVTVVALSLLGLL
jgi:uncharacterized BrkB/YihY/UPF0761 family membrane protein